MSLRVSRVLGILGLAAIIAGLIVLNLHLGNFEMIFHSRVNVSTQGVSHER